MAKKSVVEVIIRAKDLTATAIGRFRRRMKALGTSIKSVTRSLVRFTVVTAAAVVGLTKLGQQGDKVIAVKSAFARVTDDETSALNRLRAAAHGTVDDFKLMALHNQSLALGAAKSTEEFAAQIEVVRRLARAQGLAVDEGLEKFTTGMARLSTLRLDDLGIQVRQAEANERYLVQLGLGTRALTEAERATAFRNEAMRQAVRIADDMAGKENAGAEATNRFATAMVNLKDKISIVVAESPLVAEMFDKMTTVVSDLIDILNGDAALLKEAFSSLGRIAGNAFTAALAAAIRTPLQMIGDMIADRIPGGPSGPADQVPSRLFDATIENALARIGGELNVIAGLATEARRRAEGRRAGGGGGGGFGGMRGDGGAAAVPGLARRDFAGFGISPGGRATFAERQARLARARFAPGGGPQVFDVGPTQGSARASLAANEARDMLEGTQDELNDAAEAMDDAGAVATAAMFGTAQAIVAGSENIAQSLTSMITQVLRALPGVSGLAGALIGGIGGLAAGLFSRGDRRIPVSVDDYSSSALAKLRQNSGEPIHITTIIEQGGVEIERIERIQHDRAQRDATVRHGRDFGGR